MSRRTIPPPAQRTHEATSFERFDRHADLIIIAGSGRPIDKACFYVSSSKVCRASHILRAIVHQSWGHRRKGRKSRVRLPNDEPHSLRIILSILHHRPLTVPVQPTIVEVYYILLCVAKYNLSKQIRPWAPLWLQRAHATDPTENPVLLFIAWQLGDADLVGSLIQHWIANALHTQDGLVTPDGQRFGRRPVLADMDACKHVAKIRGYHVERAVNLWNTTVNGLKQDEDAEIDEYPALKSTDPNADQPCTAFVLGSLQRLEWQIIGETLPQDHREYTGRQCLLSVLIKQATEDGGRQFCTRSGEARQHCRCVRLVSRMKRRWAEILKEDMGGIAPEWEAALAQKAQWTGSMDR